MNDREKERGKGATGVCEIRESDTGMIERTTER